MTFFEEVQEIRKEAIRKRIEEFKKLFPKELEDIKDTIINCAKNQNKNYITYIPTKEIFKKMTYNDIRVILSNELKGFTISFSIIHNSFGIEWE